MKIISSHVTHNRYTGEFPFPGGNYRIRVTGEIGSGMESMVVSGSAKTYDEAKAVQNKLEKFCQGAW